VHHACHGSRLSGVIGVDFEAVLAQAQRGDELAFARLWRDLNPALLRYLGLAGDAAEEIASTTWLDVVKGLERFRGDETAWRAWVFTTARRRAVDAARKRERDLRVWRRSASWVVELADDCADVVVDAISSADALRLVRRLPALQAEVVLLRVVADLPVAEVAALLGTSQGNVRVAAHRGLKALRRILSEHGVTPESPRALREVT
jgi:RNA polymerase sigma-70 factor (ECF subfamily)